MTAMDKPASVLYDSTSATYGVLETSGIVNICQNIMHLLSHEKIPIYEWKDNMLKNYNIFSQYELQTFKHI